LISALVTPPLLDFDPIFFSFKQGAHWPTRTHAIFRVFLTGGKFTALPEQKDGKIIRNCLVKDGGLSFLLELYVYLRITCTVSYLTNLHGPGDR
jgi:hypothetical protein